MTYRHGALVLVAAVLAGVASAAAQVDEKFTLEAQIFTGTPAAILEKYAMRTGAPFLPPR